MEIRKKPKNQNNGLLAAALGITAGFIFLLAAFVGYSGELDSPRVVYIAVGICIAISFMPMLGEAKKNENCTSK
jgi:uncharacterized membrane protein YuzA (DUF378 family)